MQKTQSIAKRMALFLSAILFVMFIVVGWFQYQRAWLERFDSAQLYGETVTGNLVKSIQLAGLDIDWIQSLVVGISTEHHFERIVVFDNTGVIRAHSDPKQVGIKLPERVQQWRDLSSRQSTFYSTDANELELFEHGHAHVHILLRVVEPIESLSTQIHTMGFVLIDIDLSDAIKQLHVDVVFFGGILLLVLSGMIGVIYLFINQQILRPIIDLQSSTEAIAAGNLEKQTLIHREDELGRLALAFNSMTTELRSTTVSREYVDSILLSMTDTLIVISPTGMIEKINQPQLLGYTATDLIGSPIENIFAEEEVLFRTAKLRALVKTGSITITNADATMVAKDDRRIPVLISGSVIHNNRGERTGVVVVARDITERRQMMDDLRHAKEKAEMANQSKSAFLANMSHEIRTPMNVVLGMSEVLLETSLDQEQHSLVQTMHRSGKALLRVINDILDFSRIESGRFSLSNLPFSPRNVVVETAHLMRMTAEEKGLALPEEVTHDLPDTILGDDGRVRQILINLLGNAIKFTQHGQVSVQLSLYPEEPDTLLFRVSDTGIGIAQEHIDHIFEHFTQADSGITRRYGGTGLGLAISKKLVELMGGRMWVESQLGHGSTFLFTLPSRPVEAVASPVAPQEQATVTAARSLRILIAEDSPDNRMLLQMYLKKTPHHLTVANDGLEAVARVREEAFDLLLTDIEMPNMDGYSATRAIRQWEQEEGRQPLTIIALSAHSGIEKKGESLAAGCDGHLTKPIKKQTLLDAIQGVAESISKQDLLEVVHHVPDGGVTG